MANSGTILIIGKSWPEPTTTAAGCRILQLISCFREAGYGIQFASAASQTAHSLNLSEYGIAEVPILLNDASFEATLKKVSPDLVIFDRFMTEEQYGWRVAKSCPGAVRILDTEDLHSLRISREQSLRKGIRFSPEQWKTHPATLRELASIFRSDLSLIISPVELELLIGIPGMDSNLLWHTPFFYDPPDMEILPSYDQRLDFIFVGNGRHQPNIDAIQQLKAEIWPGIRRQLPKAGLFVYGAYLPGAVRNLDHPGSGFHVKGWTEDILDVMSRARILLAPLRFGAGIKGKLVDAMRCGTPSITTPVGAEGMHRGMPWGGAVVSGTKSFVDAAVEMYMHSSVWESAHFKSLAIINTLYKKELHAAGLLTRINELRDSLPGHRDQNLIGAMMLHHRMASTRYLSKWIEAKNKLLSAQGSEY